MEGGTIKRVKRLLVLLITPLLISSTLPVGVVNAETPSTASIVISQVQAGAVGDSTQEFISLYNNTNLEINITDWCVSNKTSTDFACLDAKTQYETLYVAAFSFVRISSESFRGAQTDFHPDAQYTTANKITASSDVITLKNEKGLLVDSVSWNKPLAVGSNLQRLAVPESDILLDTDAESDFQQLSELVIPPTGVREVVMIIDVCPNIPSEQVHIPDGFVLEDGVCVENQPDFCPNIDGLQTEIPEGFMLDGVGACWQDQCYNVEGLQIAVPDRYEAAEYQCTKKALATILLTELLANPSGNDTGAEYIEIYNPHEFVVDLQYYKLQVGLSFDKTFSFPIDATIPAQSYYVVPNTVGYVLVNTSSRVQIISDDEQVIDQTPAYMNPADNEAWALVDDVWQYTNRPTYGALNRISDLEIVNTQGQQVVTAAPCGEGKYRNPLTNRCRSVINDVAVLTSCGDDEYRSPDTNRCRKVTTVTSSLAICKLGQERNPETNRCRAVASASSVVACKEGQERNPDTNRCRNVVTATKAGSVPFAVTPSPATSSTKIGWIVAGIAAAAAIGYGAYEWRREISKFLSRNIPGKK